MPDLPGLAREQALAMMSLLRQDILLGNDDIERHYEQLGKIIRPTKHAPDVVESAASSGISPASEVSASEAESNPATTQVM